MSLSPTENLVLQTVLLQARCSTEQVSKQTGIRPHIVRRTVARLHEQKVLLGIRAYVNSYPLGLHAYLVFFSLPRTSTDKHNKLIAHLCSLDGVSLLHELSGEPQYEMHLLARNSQDALALLDSLKAIAPEIQITNFSLMHEQHYSGALGHILKNSSGFKALRYGAVSESITIDRIDHQLLSFLANESIDSHRVLAQRVKLPASTVAYRLHALETRGLIAGHYHLCDFKPLGLFPVVALVYTSVLDAATRAKLITFCNRHPVIAYVDLTVGPFSARVFMRARSYEEARQVMCDLRETFPESIQSIRIMPQLRFMRHSTYPFSTK